MEETQSDVRLTQAGNQTNSWVHVWVSSFKKVMSWWPDETHLKYATADIRQYDLFWGGGWCVCVCRGTKIAFGRKIDSVISLQGAWGCHRRSKRLLEMQNKVGETLAHAGGASAEHSWHYSRPTNNPNFIQCAGPTEWLQCIGFTHWGGPCQAQSFTPSPSKHYNIWGGTVSSVYHHRI